MKNRTFFFLLLGLIFGAGCASTKPAPRNWIPANVETKFAAPIGRYANQGESSNPKVPAPTLSALLFDKKLEGFDIDNIVFEKGGSENQLLIQPQVGLVAIKERRFLEAEKRKDEDLVWTAKTKTTYVDGYGAAASILWSGGTVMPISSWKRYRFYTGEDGSLIVHLRSKDLIDFFYFFPIPITSEIWLRYPVLKASLLPAAYPPEPIKS